MERNNNYDTTDPKFWRQNDIDGEESVLYEEDAPPPEDTVPEEDVAGGESTENEDVKSLRQLFFSLPDGLFKVALQQLAVALGALVAGLAALIVTRAPQSAILFCASGWLVWMAFSLCFDYQSGEIIEMPLICVSVQRGIKVQNRTRVVFRTQDEDSPSFFEYFIPGRKVNSFSENYVYILYVRKSNPKLLIGAQPL